MALVRSLTHAVSGTESQGYRFAPQMNRQEKLHQDKPGTVTTA